MLTKDSSMQEDIALRKRFTSYLELAVKRYKRDYSKTQYRIMEVSYPIEDCNIESPNSIESESFKDIPGWMELENAVLQKAILELDNRELCIFWNHAVEKESLAQIARDLDMPYDSVTAIYYRTLKKMRGAFTKR